MGPDTPWLQRQLLSGSKSQDQCLQTSAFQKLPTGLTKGKHFSHHTAPTAAASMASSPRCQPLEIKTIVDEQRARM